MLTDVTSYIIYQHFFLISQKHKSLDLTLTFSILRVKNVGLAFVEPRLMLTIFVSLLMQKKNNQNIKAKEIYQNKSISSTLDNVR